MREENPSPLGGEGQIVKADEMYHGKRETTPKWPRSKYLPATDEEEIAVPAQLQAREEIVGYS